MTIVFFGDLYKSFKGKTKGGGEMQLINLIIVLQSLNNIIRVYDSSIDKRMFINGVEFVPIIKSRKLLNRFTKNLFTYYSQICNEKADIFITSMRGYEHFIPLKVAKKNKITFIHWVSADIVVESWRERLIYYLKNNYKLGNILNHILNEIFYPIVLKGSNTLFVQHSKQLINAKKYNTNSIIFNNFIIDDTDITHEFSNLKQANYVWIGSLDFNKGIKDMITVINSMKKAHLFIIGKVRSLSVEKYLNQIPDCGNYNLLGFLCWEEVVKHMAISNGLINTSEKEGFPISFLEAWGMGLPVFSLHVNPGNLFDEFPFLGKCFHGDITECIEYIDTFIFDKDNCQKRRDFVLKNHSKKYAILKLKLVGII